MRQSHTRAVVSPHPPIVWTAVAQCASHRGGVSCNAIPRLSEDTGNSAH
jgi:hypothetical protein